MYETNNNGFTQSLASDITNKAILRLSNTKDSGNNVPNNAYSIQLRFDNSFIIHNNYEPLL